jgi:hypothetical protein
MIARVRWSPKRLCLEGFEVKLADVNVRIPQSSDSGRGGEVSAFASWLVAKGGAFARVSVAEGLEWHQPLECSILGAGP